MINEAFKAGIWAALGSSLGKMSGTNAVVGDSYIIWAMLLVLMVVANTWGCRYYLRSLDDSPNSLAPTVISAASSYILSGLIGVTMFNEAATIKWWSGSFLIIGGLSLVARTKSIKNKPE